MLVAKQLASLAALAPKRVLPVFGLRSAMPAERDIFPVPDGQRAAVFDESLRLLRAGLERRRRLRTVTSSRSSCAAVEPRPATPLDIWLGGSAPAALPPDRPARRRLARQLPHPGRSPPRPRAIQAAAAEAGREIEPDHFGINLAVSDGGLPAEMVAAVRSARPDVDPAELIADGWPRLHRTDRRVRRGRADQVRHPARRSAADSTTFIDRFVAELLPRRELTGGDVNRGCPLGRVLVV